MNYYELLIPHFSILGGIFALILLEISGEQGWKKNQWTIQTMVLAFAIIQQVTLYRGPSTLFLRGGLVLDALSQLMVLSVLIISFVIHINRKAEVVNPKTNVLTLLAVLFSMFCVQSNRFFFGAIALIGLIWSSQAAMACELKTESRPELVHRAMLRGFVVFVLATILSLMCFVTFGESQIDAIQMAVSRPQVSDDVFFPIQVLIMVLGLIMIGLPPFAGSFGGSRRLASWSSSIGFTTLFAIAGLNIFLRWAVAVFSRPEVGGVALEPATHRDLILSIRWIASLGLVLSPACALAVSELRKSILYFACNPFFQILFSMSFAQKEIMGFAAGHFSSSILLVGLLVSSIRALDPAPSIGVDGLKGIGRSQLAATAIMILSLAGLAGFPPFFASLTVEKTLCINSPFTFFLLLNIALSGIYVARLLTLVFHGAPSVATIRVPLDRFQRIWFFAQLIVLIFLGIFWQPLYKYGVFSIRNFFGEI